MGLTVRRKMEALCMIEELAEDAQSSTMSSRPSEPERRQPLRLAQSRDP